jgi:transposase
MEINQYIGIDLHKAGFQVCAMVPTGERLWEGCWPRTADGIAAFLIRCTPQTAVAVEATGPTWSFVDAIAEGVGQVCVVDTRKTKLKAGYAAKTDRLDARRLADALRRESVVSIYVPPPVIRELRELCRHRMTLTQLRTRVLQRLRALLLRHGLGDPPTTRLRSVAGQAWLDQIQLPPHASRALRTLRQLEHDLTAHLAIVEADVARAAAADPIVQRLQTLHGVGPVIGLMLRAEIGDIARFPTPGHLASYAGLVPRVTGSANHMHYGRITKDGSPWLRWALVEVGLYTLRRRDPLGRWGRKLAVRKTALLAQVALAREMCREIMTLWRQHAA